MAPERAEEEDDKRKPKRKKDAVGIFGRLGWPVDEFSKTQKPPDSKWY